MLLALSYLMNLRNISKLNKKKTRKSIFAKIKKVQKIDQLGQFCFIQTTVQNINNKCSSVFFQIWSSNLIESKACDCDMRHATKHYFCRIRQSHATYFAACIWKIDVSVLHDLYNRSSLLRGRSLDPKTFNPVHLIPILWSHRHWCRIWEQMMRKNFQKIV